MHVSALFVYKLVRTDRVTVECELPIDQKITPVYPIEIGFNGKGIDLLNAFLSSTSVRYFPLKAKRRHLLNIDMTLSAGQYLFD